MNNLRKNLKNFSPVKAMSDVKITAACLFLLFILTFWGTVAQVEQGLYQSQGRFFNSWFFLAAGFIPFPGAQLVLWVMFVNLLCVTISRFVFKLSHIGILVIHCGLLLYFISAFVTLHFVEESHLTLYETEGSNVSSAYHDWELSVWPAKDNTPHHVLAYASKNFQSGAQLSFPGLGINVTVKSYFSNAEAYTQSDSNNSDALNNASGIKSLTAVPYNKEPEKNIPGGIFEITDRNGNHQKLLLYGADTNPSKVTFNGTDYEWMLRHKRFLLPFTLTLKNFQVEFHPGTSAARSYTSLVDIKSQSLSREVLISMNNPLRYKDYALYQSSYSIDPMGREISTLAVVKNKGRLLPYISSLLTFAGLALHFLLMGLKSKQRKQVNYV